jgi:hypothetical protein
MTDNSRVFKKHKFGLLRISQLGYGGRSSQLVRKKIPPQKPHLLKLYLIWLSKQSHRISFIENLLNASKSTPLHIETWRFLARTQRRMEFKGFGAAQYII